MIRVGKEKLLFFPFAIDNKSAEKISARDKFSHTKIDPLRATCCVDILPISITVLAFNDPGWIIQPI